MPAIQRIAPVVLLTDILVEQHRQEEAREFIGWPLVRYLSVRGLVNFVELRVAGCRAGENESLVMLKNLTDALWRDKPVYLCRECGFAGKTSHWQCPCCKCGDTARPIRGVEGS